MELIENYKKKLEEKIQIFHQLDLSLKMTQGQIGLLQEFIKDAFDKNGDYIDKDYKAIGGPKICKWCIYQWTEHCPKYKKI